MPFVFIIVGASFLTAGIRGTSQDFLNLLKGDFLGGKNSYLFWMFSILVVGAIGYIDSFKNLSRAFLILLLVVLVLADDKNGSGFFTNLQSSLKKVTGGN